MNFHFLIEAERCPRSVALRYSSYPTVWKRRGYPDKPTISSILGQVVHSSIRRIVQELARGGCQSLRDPNAIQILKTIGGYSRVISDNTTSLLDRLSENPRFSRMREATSTALRTRMPEIREHLQILLSRLTWNKTGPAMQQTEPSSRESTSSSTRRFPLSLGEHFEVELRSESLKWVGVADLINISENECTITDFKSGEESELHSLQIRVYGLLWYHDADLNPDKRPASTLVLSYLHGDTVVSWAPSQLLQLTQEINSRTDSARKALEPSKPFANLSEDNCRRCSVRHLCDEYWTDQRKQDQSSGAQSHAYFDDIEILVHDRKSSNAWQCECSLSNTIATGTKVLLRISPTDILLADQLKGGTTVRLVDALVSSLSDAEPSVIHVTANTEILFI